MQTLPERFRALLHELADGIFDASLKALIKWTSTYLIMLYVQEFKTPLQHLLSVLELAKEITQTRTQPRIQTQVL
jgi:hypothetical protein